MTAQEGGKKTDYVYRSRYGVLIKHPHGVCEYWYKRRFIAVWYSANVTPPECRPTSAEWAFCVEMRELLSRQE